MNAPLQREKEHERLVREAMGLWAIYAENYRTYPELYEMLLEKRKALGISANGVKRMSKADLETYPDIPLFRIENREVVLEKLTGMKEDAIRTVIRDAESLSTNYAYQTYKSKILDIQYQIDRAGKPKSTFGYDPDRMISRRNGGRKSTRTGGSE